MRKHLTLLLALAFVAAACGSTPSTSVESTATAETEATTAATEAPAPTEAPTEETEATEATTAPEDTTAEVEDTPALVAEGPDVPGVVLALDNGGTLDVANADRPLMLVFWAEW